MIPSWKLLAAEKERLVRNILLNLLIFFVLLGMAVLLFNFGEGFLKTTTDTVQYFTDVF